MNAEMSVTILDADDLVSVKVQTTNVILIQSQEPKHLDNR
jgi:hypothetical protein